MKDSRFKIGIFITVFWLIIMVVFLMVDIEDTKHMKPNEWGDFFSGFFAPLAFLWLILGYLQQGKELQLSTHALELQAEELKNSVEQQKELVEVSRLQIESERVAFQMEQLEKTRAAQPRFIIRRTNKSTGSTGFGYQFDITNAGNGCSNLKANIFIPGHNCFTVLNIPFINKSSTSGGSFKLSNKFPDSGAYLDISYTDSYDVERKIKFNIANDIQNDLIFTQVTDALTEQNAS